MKAIREVMINKLSDVIKKNSAISMTPWIFLHMGISPRNQNNMQKNFRVWIIGPDRLESWKKTRVKMLWHCSFNSSLFLLVHCSFPSFYSLFLSFLITLWSLHSSLLYSLSSLPSFTLSLNLLPLILCSIFPSLPPPLFLSPPSRCGGLW